MSSLSIAMAAAGTSEGLDSEDITNTAISQDSENIFSKDSLENSADADISPSTESHTAEIFLASVGLQPSRDQKEVQETPKLFESKPMELSNSGLPPGWKKIYVQRTSGKTAGKYDAYIFSPDGRKHRSKTELFAYLEKKNLAGQYNINEFDFTIRDVHVADGTDASTSSTPASQTKAERKRSKGLTPKQIRMSEASSKKSKKRKPVEVSPEISPPVKKLAETTSKKSKKRKMDPSEASSTPSVSGIKKFKKMKAESERSESSHFRKKVKSPPRLKLPMKKLKIKLKFSIPAKREKVLLDSTADKADMSAAPDSLAIKTVDAESLDKTISDAVSDVSTKDLFDRSLSEDVSFETNEKELLERCLNDGCSETDGKESHNRSMDEEVSSDLKENELQRRSSNGSVEEMVDDETREGSRTEATTSRSSCTKNSISSKSRDEASSSPLPDYETPSHISEILHDNKRYRNDSENDLSDNDVDDRNDEGSANASNSFSTFSSSHSKIATETNTGGKAECNNNSPKHTGSDCKVEPLPTEDICVNSSEFNHCNNVEQRLQSDDVVPTKKWYPPQSPYNLIEEQLDNDPWKVLVVSIFIESGDVCFEAGSLPRRSVKAFFKLCPSPKRVIQYGRKRIFRSLEDHHISKETVAKISKFSEEYLSNPVDDPSSLHGIGKYGQDTYRIFCINEWKQVVPENRKLKDYHRWLWRNHRVFCKQ